MNPNDKTDQKIKTLKPGPKDLDWLAGNFKLGELNAFGTPELMAVVPHLTLLEVAPHQTLVREGETGSDLFVVYEGEVSVNKKRGMFAAGEVVRLKAGDYFGEIGLIGGALRSATVSTEKPSKIWKVPAAELKAALEKRPELASHLKKVAVQRLAKLAEFEKQG